MADSSTPTSPPSAAAASAAPAPVSAPATPPPALDAAAAKAAAAAAKAETDAAAAKVAAIRKANADAAQRLTNYFGAERWSKIVQRAQRTGMSVDNIAALAGEMVATRQVHHPKNPQAALIGAANGFICAIGMSPTDADVTAFESALTAPAV